MAEKVFFGNVKEITNDYGTMYSLGMTKDDINKLTFNEKGFANVQLKKWKSGKWYMEVPQNTQQAESNTKEQDVDSDDPF